MEGIKNEVVELLDDELMEYIFEDTRNLIHTFESKVLKKEYEIFSKFDKLMERVQNVIELSFRYVDNPKNTIPSDVAWLLIDLTELKSTICNCDYIFEELNDCNEPKILDDLGEFITDTASGYFVERDYYFTTEDIEAYKNKIAAENEAQEIRSKKMEIEHQEYVAKKKAIVEEWLKEHANNDFDFSVLSDNEIEILKAAHERDLKSLSVSWIQRRFAMGYCKAATIIDHLEECGAISTFEDVEELGLGKSGRIVRITFE